jgi:hypothetical protein
MLPVVRDPNLKEAALTVPETVMVPPPRPVPLVSLPKLRGSLMRVVTLFPRTTAVPAEDADHPAVAVPVVGAAQVPDALPKLAALSFPSQKRVVWPCAE